MAASVNGDQRSVPGVYRLLSRRIPFSNLKKIDGGTVDLGLTYPVWTYDAWVGRAIFEGKQYRNIRSIGKIAVHPFQLTVPAKSKIRTIMDLKDKNLAVGPRGVERSTISGG